MTKLRSTICFGLAGLFAMTAAAFAQDGQMPPKQVGVVQLKTQDIPRIVTLPGRAVSGADALIRPQVGGMITEILYTEGSAVKKGDPMFQIDRSTYDANLSSAEASVTSAQAALTESETSYSRTERLLGSGTTQAQVDAARATLDQARAALQTAQASLQLAQKQLEWTTVTSPIDGMATVAEVSVGDLVTASQSDELATVVQLDPIDVDMYEPSVRMLSVFNDITSGRLSVNEKLTATLTLETGETYQAEGELLAPGFTVSTSTGAVDTRFRFANPDNLILPGMFLRGQVDLGTMRGILVSQSAATRNRTGQLTAWVIVDGKAQQRNLHDDGTYQNSWIVTDGVAEGELLAVDGLTGLTDGAEVVTIPVTYDETGVVRETGQPEQAAEAGEPAAPSSDETKAE